MLSNMIDIILKDFPIITLANIRLYTRNFQQICLYFFYLKFICGEQLQRTRRYLVHISAQFNN